MAAQPVHPVIRLAVIVVLAVVYFGAARASLVLAFPSSSASPVWPPTGLALAALLVLGAEVWPGIALGAFLANFTTSLTHQVATPVALWTSGAIALGNTGEALIAAFLVRRFAGGRNTFDRTEHVFKYVLLGALVSTMVSATVGTTALGLGGIAPWAVGATVWLTWWLGDVTGALVVTPLLVAWSKTPPPKPQRWQIIEVVLALALLTLVGRIVFAGGYPLVYLLIPFVLWAAFRFGQRGAATTTLVIAGIATWGTIRHTGPFLRGTLNESLLFVQVYTGVVAFMSMLVAAALAERRKAEAQLADYNRTLKQQIHRLRIDIDDAKKSKAVSEITETDYFQDLQQKAARLRRKSGAD